METRLIQSEESHKVRASHPNINRRALKFTLCHSSTSKLSRILRLVLLLALCDTQVLHSLGGATRVNELPAATVEILDRGKQMTRFIFVTRGTTRS